LELIPQSTHPFSVFLSFLVLPYLTEKVIGSRGCEILNHDKQINKQKKKELCQDEPKHLKGRTLLEQKFIDIMVESV
jgi:hypothetical protein